MPNRIIRDVGLTSRKLAAASDFGERLYWRIYQAVDDYGRFHGDPALILARCFPLMTDSVSHQRVMDGRDELAELGLIRLYQVGEDEVLQITKFEQRVRAERSRFPAPDDGQVTVRGRSNDGPPARDDPSSPIQVPSSPNREGPGEGGAKLRLVDEPDCRECLSLLALLNKLTCRMYSAAGGMLSLLHDRHVQHGSEKVIAVIRDRVSAWGGDAKMHRFLRPETLFAARKFDGYVNALSGPVHSVVPDRCVKCGIAARDSGSEYCWPCGHPRVPVVVSDFPKPQRDA